MMKMMICTLLRCRGALVLFVLVVGFGVSNAGAQQATDGPAPGAAQEIAEGPAMWRVETSRSTMYILGTFHLLMPGMVWQSPRILNAFDEADTVTFEMSPEQSDPNVVAWVVSQRGVYTGFDSLDRHLDVALWEALMRHARSTGIPVSTISRFKPWYAATAITIQSAMMIGFRAELGVESILEARAEDHEIPVFGLEMAVEQIEALADLPMETQIELLEQSLEEFSTLEVKFEEMSAAWLSGDEEVLSAVLVDEVKEYDDVYQSLYLERNRNWVPLLVGLLNEPGIHFVAVGTAHLVGDESVIAGLRARGFTVERY